LGNFVILVGQPLCKQLPDEAADAVSLANIWMSITMYLLTFLSLVGSEREGRGYPCRETPEVGNLATGNANKWFQ
jgi:hypothetical protein